jgi:hypothetical protein
MNDFQEIILAVALAIAPCVGCAACAACTTYAKASSEFGIKALSDQIEVAKAEGKEETVKILEGKRADKVAEYEEEEKAIARMVAAKNPKTKEERKEATEEAVSLLEAVDANRVQYGATKAESTKWMKENGIRLTDDQEKELNAYFAAVGKIKKARGDKEAQEMASGDVYGAELDTIMASAMKSAMGDASKKTEVFSGNIVTLNVGVEGLSKK